MGNCLQGLSKSASGVANPKTFVNSDAKEVQDGIEGIVLATPHLARLDGYPDIKVVIRSDWDKSKVAVISGGGSGHEPLHGGFVGKGMLTAAVSGEVFASPSVEAVLAAICAVTGKSGCLLVIKNYTGDRLNFAVAAQKARVLFKLKVETVVVDDDIATSAKRGIAGTLFVHKIAGAAAEEGLSLEKVKEQAQSAIDATASLGVALSTCGRRYPERMSVEEMEVGLGIHGEAGASREPRRACAAIVRTVCSLLETHDLSKAKLQGKESLAALVNNLGAVPPVEMGIICKELMATSVGSRVELLVGPMPLCTSLDMNGFSISLLSLSGGMKSRLQAPTSAPAWPGVVVPNRRAVVPMPFAIKDVSSLVNAKPSNDAKVDSALEALCRRLMKEKKELDRIDAIVGDADCGTTMATAASRILELKSSLPLGEPELLCRALSDACGLSMGGSSGVLLRIMFLGMAEHLQGASAVSWEKDGGAALMAGVESMMNAGGAREGDRTMLDALVPAARTLRDGGSIGMAASGAKAGADSTRLMSARAGRSENVPAAELSKARDPGAVAVSMAFEELAAVLR